jgi:hypothetical protein
MNTILKPIKVVNERHLELEFDPALSCIIQVWKGYFSSELFRKGVESTNQLFKEKKPVRKFLVDISTSGVISQDDTTWAAQFAIPVAIENGLKYYGFVLPSNIFAQASLNNFKRDLNQPTLEIKLFDSLEKGKEWMRSL